MTENRLLIIDDDHFVAEYVCECAKEIGFESNCVSSPKDFWNAYEILKPTHVVADIFMPNEDGIEIIRELAQRVFAGQLILMSNSCDVLDSAHSLAEACRLRPVLKLNKPIRFDDLKSVLETDFVGPCVEGVRTNDESHGVAN